MFSLVKNLAKMVILASICTINMQATHDFNELSEYKPAKKSAVLALEKFLSRRNLSNEFEILWNNQNLRNQLCHQNFSQDFFEKELSNYLTTETIQEHLPKLHALSNKLCKKILQTSQYSLKIKLGFDDAENKIGYNAQAKNIVAHTGMNKYIATYPTSDSPFQSKSYNFCIQLGYDLLRDSSDISLERTIAHEIGHIKHEHKLKKRFYHQLTLLTGLLIPLFLSYYFFSENLSLPVLIVADMVLSFIFLYFFEEKISNRISRYHEIEADKTSIEALLSNNEIIQSNYNIFDIINFIEREENRLETSLNYTHTNTTHPLPETRFEIMSDFAKGKLRKSNQNMF